MGAADELTLVGRFPNPFGNNHAAKVTAINNGAWSPDTDDFVAVAHEAGIKVPVTMNDVLGLIGSILQRPKRSLKTINVITHGDPGTIGLTGRIELPRSGALNTGSTVYFSSREAESITDTSLTTLEDTGSFTMGTKTFEWGDVRDRFAPGATMVLYSCKAASGKGGTPSSVLLKRIAYVMGVAVTGFVDIVAYCVATGGRQLRYTVGVGSCTGGTGVQDFHDLPTQGRNANPKRVVDVARPAQIANP